MRGIGSNDDGTGIGEGSLNGRVALVTGVAKGIGRAIALKLAGRGAAVAINCRNGGAAAENVAAEIQDMGGDCILIRGDVAVEEEARRVVKEVVDAWKRVDILVNNAGITRDKSLRKMSDDDWADVINVNLNGTYYCINAALPFMIQQKFGRIINISSYVGQNGNLGQSNYEAGKSEIIAFTKALALGVAKHNITANAIAPGFVCTEALSSMPPNILEQIRSKIPLGRFANPDEVASAAVFLAAEGAYITGHQLNVNGGLYM